MPKPEKPKPPTAGIEKVLAEIQRNLKHQEVDPSRMTTADLVRLILETSPKPLGTKDICIAIFKLTGRMSALETTTRLVQRLMMYNIVCVAGKEARTVADGTLRWIPVYKSLP